MFNIGDIVKASGSSSYYNQIGEVIEIQGTLVRVKLGKENYHPLFLHRHLELVFSI